MTNSKLYLDVPYPQKDQAKALGAKWDASRKKWYIPNGVESASFAQWKPQALAGGDSLPGKLPKSAGKASKPVADAQGLVTVARALPVDKNFVPYCGEDPPWE
jgi:hypothetical protein